MSGTNSAFWFLAPFLRCNAWSQRRDLRLKVLTHSVMILLRVEVFYTAVRDTFLSSSQQYT